MKEHIQSPQYDVLEKEDAESIVEICNNVYSQLDPSNRELMIAQGPTTAIPAFAAAVITAAFECSDRDEMAKKLYDLLKKYVEKVEATSKVQA